MGRVAFVDMVACPEQFWAHCPMAIFRLHQSARLKRRDDIYNVFKVRLWIEPAQIDATQAEK